MSLKHEIKNLNYETIAASIATHGEYKLGKFTIVRDFEFGSNAEDLIAFYQSNEYNLDVTIYLNKTWIEIGYCMEYIIFRDQDQNIPHEFVYDNIDVLKFLETYNL